MVSQSENFSVFKFMVSLSSRHLAKEILSFIVKLFFTYKNELTRLDRSIYEWWRDNWLLISTSCSTKVFFSMPLIASIKLIISFHSQHFQGNFMFTFNVRKLRHNLTTKVLLEWEARVLAQKRPFFLASSNSTFFETFNLALEWHWHIFKQKDVVFYK